jgi:large subunit ribosomal protein L5
MATATKKQAANTAYHARLKTLYHDELTKKLQEELKLPNVHEVTLRDVRMYEFADRVINVVLPRLRDFHGVPVKAFDKQGNYSLGFTDQSTFPELSYEETSTAHGLQIIFVVKAKSPQHSRALLEAFGLPFQKEQSR